jgi:hypothetical protein
MASDLKPPENEDGQPVPDAKNWWVGFVVLSVILLLFSTLFLGFVWLLPQSDNETLRGMYEKVSDNVPEEQEDREEVGLEDIPKNRWDWASNDADFDKEDLESKVERAGERLLEKWRAAKLYPHGKQDRRQESGDM